MNPAVEQLDLPSLVENLADLQERRTPVGWTPDDAALKSSIERRIMELVAGEAPETGRDGERIPCAIAVKVKCKDYAVRGNARDLGVGGVFIETSRGFPIGTTVDVELRGTSTEEHGLRVRGTVAYTADVPHKGVGISFASQFNDRNERRLRRFVLELLRHRDSAA